MTATAHTAYELARLAECMDPDSHTSTGAGFLQTVAEGYADAVSEGWFDEDDGPHEIADNAVPVYTHERWQTFVDLGAYDEDITELGADASDLNQCAATALYMIADRLVRALHDAREEDDES